MKSLEDQNRETTSALLDLIPELGLSINAEKDVLVANGRELPLKFGGKAAPHKLINILRKLASSPERPINHETICACANYLNNDQADWASATDDNFYATAKTNVKNVRSMIAETLSCPLEGSCKEFLEDRISFSKAAGAKLTFASRELQDYSWAQGTVLERKTKSARSESGTLFAASPKAQNDVESSTSLPGGNSVESETTPQDCFSLATVFQGLLDGGIDDLLFDMPETTEEFLVAALGEDCVSFLEGQRVDIDSLMFKTTKAQKRLLRDYFKADRFLAARASLSAAQAFFDEVPWSQFAKSTLFQTFEHFADASETNAMGEFLVFCDRDYPAQKLSAGRALFALCLYALFGFGPFATSVLEAENVTG